MKKIIIIWSVLLLVCFQSIKAQDLISMKPYYQPKFDTLVAYDTLDNKTSRIIRTFDIKGNVLTESSEMWKNNQWSTQTTTTLTYDDRGNLLNINYLDGFFQMIGVYDKNNNLLSHILQGCIGNNCEEEKEIYVYDKRGNVLSREELKIKNNIEKTECKYAYTYDKHNNKLSTVLVAGKNGRKIIYAYDRKNNLISQEEFPYRNDALAKKGEIWGEKQRQIVYTYDKSNNITSHVMQYSTRDYSSGITTWKTQEEKTYTYNERGDLLTEEKKTLMNGTLETVYYYSYAYEYDERGNKVEIIKHKKYGNNYDQMFQKNSYDDQNRLRTKVEEYEINENEFINRNVFMFDENGNLLSHTIERKNTPSIRLTYTYNSEGMSISGKCEEFRNNNWYPAQFINNSELKFYGSPQNILTGLFSNCYRFEVLPVSFK